MAIISALVEGIDVAMKLSELGQKLWVLIDTAKGSRVESKVLLYLQVAQTAIRALGRERQGILSDAAGCDIQNKDQVDALSERMRVYLREDNVRGPFKEAIAGLKGCRQDIERAAHGLKWRKRDKQEAVQNFLSTLDDLQVQAQELENTYFPGCSGQGLGTLVPVRDMIDRIRDDLRRGHSSDVGTDEEKLGELIEKAFRDPAQATWIDRAAHIEQLIVKLQLSFSVKGGSSLGQK